MTGFIEQFKIISKQLGTQEDWAELQALSLLGVVSYPLSYYMRSNLFVLAIGRPGTGKSRPVEQGPIPLLRTIQVPSNKVIPEKLPKGCKGLYRFRDYLIIGQTTPEGIMQEFEQRETNGKGLSCALVVTELSELLKRAGVVEYMSGYEQMLCNFFDGSPVGKVTQEYTRTIYEHHLSLIGCMTLDNFCQLQSSFFAEGLASRLLYCHIKKKTMKALSEQEQEYFKYELSKLANLFMIFAKTLESLPRHVIRYEEGMEKYFFERRKNWLAITENDSKVLGPYKDVTCRYDLFLQKLSLLYALSRQFDYINSLDVPKSGIIPMRQSITISQEDIERANSLLIGQRDFVLTLPTLLDNKPSQIYRNMISRKDKEKIQWEIELAMGDNDEMAIEALMLGLGWISNQGLLKTIIESLENVELVNNGTLIKKR